MGLFVAIGSHSLPLEMLLGKAGGERSRAHPYFWAPFVHVGD